MLTEDKLVEEVTAYDKNADTDALRRAYVYASKMHEKQKRESGEPYIIHPVNVAEILIEYHLDYKE